MHIRCPHCRQPIEMVDDDPGGDLTCDSCGSGFNLATDSETINDDGSQSMMIGQFQLLNCLGQGAFGSVWKARDTELDRTVAIKLPRKEQLSSSEAEKFLREARAAAQVRHANIVSVHEVGREGGRFYIASDYIDGASLDQWIEVNPPTVRESVGLCTRIAEALHEAHEAGVIHRDLKPQNILIDTAGEPHITDFGLAKREAGEITMTVEGAILGTPAYMSPEQARGDAHKADRRSDVYSLGVILYRLLTGELPFRGRSQMLLLQILKEEPPALRKLDARLPRDVETICLKCLDKDPARRYQTAAELWADLDRWTRGHPIQARRTGQVERMWRWCRREPRLAMLTAGIAMSLITGTAVSTLFAVDAADSADKASVNEGKALNARDRARQAQADAEAAHEKAASSQKTAEKNADRTRRVLYASEMIHAQTAWENTDIPRVLEILNSYREGMPSADLRGFEWHYWNKLCHSNLVTLRWDLPAATHFAFSRDGKWFAATSGSRKKTIYLNTETRTATYLSHDERVEFLALHPTGDVLATTHSDGTVKLWNVATGEVSIAFKSDSRRGTRAVFDFSGNLLATTGADLGIKLWTLDGQLLRHLNKDTRFGLVAFSPDGTELATTQESQLRILDAETGAQKTVLSGKIVAGLSGISFSPDGKRIGCSTTQQQVVLWNVEDGSQIVSVEGEIMERANAVAFSPDSSLFASAGPGRTARLWHTASGESASVIPGYGNAVLGLSFVSNGTQVLVADSGPGTLRFWKADWKPFTSIERGGRHATFSSDGTRVYFTARDSDAVPFAVRSFDLMSRQESKHVMGKSVWAECMALSPDQKLVALVGSHAGRNNGRNPDVDHEVRVCNMKTGEDVAMLTGHVGYVSSVEFSPDGNRIASADVGGTVRIWETTEFTEVRSFRGGTGRGTREIGFSPDSRQVAITELHTISLWDVDNAGSTFELPKEFRLIRGFAFSPDGTQLAVADEDGTVTVFSASTGKELGTLRGHRGSIYDLNYSPDGNRIATAGYDQTVKLWDVSTWRETLTLKGHVNSVHRVRFSPDGKKLVSSSSDLHVWDSTFREPQVIDVRPPLAALKSE